MVRVMALFGADVEYGLHTLIWLAKQPSQRPSSRDLADLQKLPPAMLAKILSKLEKAGIVKATTGIQGGYGLGRAPQDISILNVVDALKANRAFFDCKNIRAKCALWGSEPPYKQAAVCGIHAAMLLAEKAMKTELANHTIASVSMGAYAKAPGDFLGEVSHWLNDRGDHRDTARIEGIRSAARRSAKPGGKRRKSRRA